MASKFSPTRCEFSEDQSLAERSVDTNIRFPGGEQPSLRKRAARGLTRFLIIFCMGVAATLAWQAYGDATRLIIASSYPDLGWLAPQTAFAQTAPEMVASTATDTKSPDWPELKTMSLSLATVRQSVDQLAAQLVASQEQMASEIAKLRDKISAPPRQQAAAPARKPVPVAPPQLSEASPAR